MIKIDKTNVEISDITVKGLVEEIVSGMIMAAKILKKNGITDERIEDVFKEATKLALSEEAQEEKPNCYKCEYRGCVPGSAHSSCKYPGVSNNLFDLFNEDNARIFNELKIKGSPTGIKNGWFTWPFDFDPVWLDRCRGFKPRDSDGKP